MDEKLWIKLTRSVGTHKAGAIVEIDAAIARAYIDAGAAEEHAQAGPALADSLSSEVTAAVAELRNSIPALVKDAVAGQMRGVAEGLRPTPRVELVEAEDDKKLRTGGFRSVGHFARTLLRGMDPSGPDSDAATQLRDYQGLVTRAVSGMSAGADPEGGLLIPPEFSAQLWDKSREYENLASRIGLTPVSGNAMSINGNAESSRADGSRFGGVQGYWAGEAAQYTGSKPTFYQVNLKTHKLTVLVYATNELLDDSGGAIESYINRVAPGEIAFKVNDALIRGTGAGMPLGILNAPALITCSAVSGQGASTLVPENFAAMWARCYGPSRRNAVWLINQDIEPQLDGLKYATGSSSGQLVYQPPTGISTAPYSTIKGRPVVLVEQCSTLGTVGDVILADMSQYVGIAKAGGVKSDMSIHLRFDYDETVFKFSLRMDAQPMWKTSLTPFKGSNSQSPFLALSSTRT